MKIDTPAPIPHDEFPILEHGHYANHAAIAPWPRSTAQAVSAFAQENISIAAQRYAHWLLRENKLRAALAKLLNADLTNDIALLKNTTEGICTVASGIAWRKGDNIVLPAAEFPSNRLPWLALQTQGVELREVDIRVDNPEQALFERMDKRTRLLSVSAVQWTDGLRLKLDVLGRNCRQNGIFFFVDAIQQLGAMQLDVQACQIDFLAADGHKWLMAPEGIAVFYCREAVREQVQVSQHGWHMVNEPYQFDRQHWPPSQAASKYEAGSPNTLGQTALFASVELLQSVGMEQVEACVQANTKALYRGLGAITGAELVRPLEPQRISGIVSFKTPGHNLLKVFQALQHRQLSCALRNDAIRLSPHFYQVGKPLQAMLGIICDVLE